MATTTAVGASYSSQHPDYIEQSKKWILIQDVLKGELAVKAKTIKYLPLENSDNSADTTEFGKRYALYLEKAKFYNATARTLSGFVGQVFNKQATQEFPEKVKYLQDDPCGTGITLEQLAKGTLANTVSYGRCGLWVDFPETGGSYTAAEVKEKAIRPVITRYEPLNILNWRTTKLGAKTLLSLVVLREKVLVEDNEFESRYEDQFRVLRLTDGVYTVQIYKPWLSDSVWQKVVTPTDNAGKPFEEIPFVFIGIQTNDFVVDEAPLYDMASLNIAHYRNSADYEEACFMVGQPMIWYSGLDEAWVRDVMKGTVRLGSRGGIPLPSGGAAGLLQVASNTMCKEAMDQKESQMIALGARIVRESNVAKTATEVNSDKVSEVSTLAAGARSTSSGLRNAFAFCQKFAGTNVEIKYELATDFDMTRMTSQELLAIVTAWQAGLIVTESVYDIFTRAGYVTMPLKDAQAKGLAMNPPVATDKPAAPTDNRATPKPASSV